MALAEKEPARSEILASLDLSHMNAVREVLTKVVMERYEVAGLKGLESATPEDQKEIVNAVLKEAREKYVGLKFYGKVPQVGEIEEAYNQGLLTLPDLLQGLGLKTQVESGRRGFLDRIKSSLKL